MMRSFRMRWPKHRRRSIPNPRVGMVYTDYLTMDESGKVLGPGSRTKIPYSKDRLLLDFMTFHFRLLGTNCSIASAGWTSDLTRLRTTTYASNFQRSPRFVTSPGRCICIASIANPSRPRSDCIRSIAHARQSPRACSGADGSGI